MRKISYKITLPPEIGQELTDLQEAYNIEDDQSIKDRLSAHILQVQHELIYPVTLTEEIATKLQKNGFYPPTEVQARRDLDEILQKRDDQMAELTIKSGKPDPRLNRPLGYKVNLKDKTTFEIRLSKLGECTWHVPSKKYPGKINLVGCNWTNFQTVITEDFDIESIEVIYP